MPRELRAHPAFKDHKVHRVHQAHKVLQEITERPVLQAPLDLRVLREMRVLLVPPVHQVLKVRPD